MRLWIAKQISRLRPRACWITLGQWALRLRTWREVEWRCEYLDRDDCDVCYCGKIQRSDNPVKRAK